MDTTLPKGVIFDMDGVLVDSERFICKAAIEMFAGKGVQVKPEDFLPFVGTGENRFIGGVAEKYKITLDIDKDKSRTYDIYEQLIKGQLKPLEGVHDFIKLCRTRGKKIAVASSADMRKVRANLTEIGLGLDTFDAVITGEDVENKKPSPDIFLLAAKRIGLDPSHCLVVEDAINGVAAAKAAGAKCLAVMSCFSREQLSQADWVSTDLAHTLSAVLQWENK